MVILMEMMAGGDGDWGMNVMMEEGEADEVMMNGGNASGWMKGDEL